MTIVCPNCTAKNQSDSEFCEQCGALLPAAEDATGTMSDTSGAQASALMEGAMEARGMNKLVCPNKDCGVPLAPGDEFCFNCGTDVRSITGLNPERDPVVAPTGSTLAGVAEEIAQEKAMSDAALERALSQIGNGSPPSNGQVAAGQNLGSSNPGQPVQTQTSTQTVVAPPPAPAPNGAPVSAVGPEAQPAVMPPEQAPDPAVGATGGGSLPATPGPNGGIAGNAFGAPAQAPTSPQTATNGAGGTFKLHIAGPYGDEVVEWTGQEILLGRNDAKTRVFPQVNLDDSAASRRHLAVWREDGDSLYYVQDLESANGTQLNGRDLKPGEPTELHHGDVLKIGTRYNIQVRIS